MATGPLAYDRPGPAEDATAQCEADRCMRGGGLRAVSGVQGVEAVLRASPSYKGKT